MTKKLCDVVREDNWIQGNYNTSDGACCLVGGLRIMYDLPDNCSPDHPNFGKYVDGQDQLFEVILALYPEKVNDCVCVEDFNDHDDTTYEMIEEVIQYYDTHFSD